MPGALKRVAIIGAGIGGLCTAIGLQRSGLSPGLQVDVFEQTRTFGEVGAGLTLWPNAIQGLRRLGIEAAELDAARVGCTEVRDWHGRVFSQMQVDQFEQELGAPCLALHRANLHRALLAHLLPGTVHTGAAFSTWAVTPQGVEAHFADGQVVQADLLIGADGIDSRVRRGLLPEVHPRYSGYSAWRGVVTLPAVVNLGITSETWGRGERFGIVPIDAQRLYWFATANVPAGRRLSPAEHKAELRQRFRGWTDPIEAVIEATPEAKILYNDIYDFAPLPRWSAERVVLVGDAAHATTPNMGQGACQAIESSLVLSRCLAEEDSLPAALARYERERKPRAAWITNQSRLIGQVGQLENPLLCTLRDFVMRITPASAARAQFLKASRAIFSME